MQLRKGAIESVVMILEEHRKAEQAIESVAGRVASRDRAMLHAMVYGVLRHCASLLADYSRFCRSKPDPVAAAALLVGTFQLRAMRVPPHAAVSETVAAVKTLRPKVAGYVNAVLRRVAENAPPAKLKPYQRAELPAWIYARWRAAFGAESVQRFAATLTSPPPLCVAVFGDRDRWIEQVRTMGVEADAGKLSDYAVLMPTGTAVTSLPGYDDGVFTVIDQAAQSAVLALQMESENGVIVDLCAAPGGKTAMLSHTFPDARIIAVELSRGRMERLQQNLQRLHCRNVSLICADATGLPFVDGDMNGTADAIMLDAPCSASGILRRHPDARYLHSADDVAALAQTQRRMVIEALRVLKPGGELCYAACSIHPEENEQVLTGLQGVIERQRRFPDATHDGFFHARLRREASR